MSFLHGIEILRERARQAAGARLGDGSTVGVVGTAPAGPVNVPTLVATAGDAAQFGSGLGTLPAFLNLILSAFDARIVVVNRLDPEVNKAAVAAAEFTFGENGEIVLPDVYVRNVVVKDQPDAVTYDARDDYTVDSAKGTVTRVAAGDIAAGATVRVAYDKLSVAGNLVAVAEKDYVFAAGSIDLGALYVENVVVKNNGGDTTYVAGDDYTVDAARGIVTRLGAGNIGAGDTVKIAFSKREGLLAAAAMAGTAVAQDGVHALPGSVATGAKPKLLCVPGYSEDAGVRAALTSAAEELLGIAIIESANTSDAAAIADAATVGHHRAFMIDPDVVVASGAATAIVPGSAAAVLAFLAADNDAEGYGVHRSPSNRLVPGVLGTARNIGVSIGSRTSSANVLNEAGINTFVNLRGWRLWGGRTRSVNAEFAQVNVVRTDDRIQEAFIEHHLDAVDAGIERGYLQYVADGVSATLREMRQNGEIVDGRAWVDPERNTPSSIANGRAIWAYDFAPVYAAERLTFYVQINNGYLSQLLNEAA